VLFFIFCAFTLPDKNNMSENNNLDLDDLVKNLIEKTDQVHDGIKTKTFISLKRLSTEIEEDLKEAK
jgi:hypothetical protein